MRSCPTCGAACAEADLFCEADGTKLSPSEATSAAAPAHLSVRASGACEACGADDSDDGDGYCTICGHRLGGAATAPAAAPSGASSVAAGSLGLGVRSAAAGPGLEGLSPGARLGNYVVRNSAGDRATASTPDGVEVLLVVGRRDALAHEAAALDRVGAHRAFPGVVERDENGAFLALSAPSNASRMLADVVQNRTVEETVGAIAGLLDLATIVEEKGFTFTPAPSDLFLAPDGSVLLSRLRGARPLANGERLDGRRMLEALGDIFLAPAIMGPTGLVRLLAPSREPGERTLTALRSALDAVTSELAVSRPHAPIAELCDAGLWRPYNQDSTAVDSGVTASGEPFVVLVVCDGVSSSSFSERASRVAARAARDALGHFARSADIAHDSAASAVAQAIRAAHIAICVAHVAEPVLDPPGTTIAAAFVFRKRLTVGWVGDSRVYWLTPRGAELLTHDHSWVNEAIARGEVKDADEVQGALAHTITKCLGPLEVGDVPMEIEPDVRARDLPGPGLVLLCSDGLWNYAPKAADIAAVIRAATDGTDAVEVSRLLVNYALARGGQDNVSVVVYAHA